MDIVVHLVVWLNALANTLGGFFLAPLDVLPDWLSGTIVSVLTGVGFLAVFKYTSNQRAIKRVRDDISANLLALKLFKESAVVAVQAQGRLFIGAVRLLYLAIVPMLVMALPVMLILGQLSLWYQDRPLRVGEETVITMKLHGDVDSPWPDVVLQPTEAVEDTIGPVRIASKTPREICWNVKAREVGYHRLVFVVDGETFDRDLAIGAGCMGFSSQRPGWSCLAALEHPKEKPFGPESPVESIEIDYLPWFRWNLWGIYPWMFFWFAVSTVAGLCFSRFLNVNI